MKAVDKEKLKTLAEAQECKDWGIFFAGISLVSGRKMFSLNGPSGVSCHENWGFTLESAQYIAAADPAAVLALIAEIERGGKIFDQSMRALDRVNAMWHRRWLSHTGEPYPIPALSRDEEFEELKAENQALRKAISGKVLCDLELFESLRDSAAAEADQHQQFLSGYRPYRQQLLDQIVERCDQLIADVTVPRDNQNLTCQVGSEQ
ncbi:hypothetical protein [Pseudomonas sp. HN2-3]|uniref:hypothetical protein n=1 Tax=Pseudomonas sp. HN2-3 TaxID=2886360 RepID=UPI001D10A845|nr:hypothetical protein [Pseudomonas sp. HN2-3]UDU80132.1 hypothetical protein LJX93_20400 [Pseudomonas sp. HN2-3]